jgi:hypothetical protein
MFFCRCASLSSSRHEPCLRSASLGQGVILNQQVITFTNIFYSLSFAQNSVSKFEIQSVIKFNFQSILFVIFLYVMYYASLLRQWHSIMIVVRTNHPYLRVRCYSWYQSITGAIHHVRPFFKNHDEDTLRCLYKDYSSVNRWQANWDLLSAFSFYKLLFCNDAPTKR